MDSMHIGTQPETVPESFHETGTIWVPLTLLIVFYLLGHQNLFLKAFCINRNVSFNKI